MVFFDVEAGCGRASAKEPGEARTPFQGDPTRRIRHTLREAVGAPRFRAHKARDNASRAPEDVPA